MRAVKCALSPALPTVFSGNLRNMSIEGALEYASSCCIPTTWKEYKLIGVTPYNHDTSIFAFGLDEGQSLNLPVCGCILMANLPAV